MARRLNPPPNDYVHVLTGVVATEPRPPPPPPWVPAFAGTTDGCYWIRADRVRRWTQVTDGQVSSLLDPLAEVYKPAAV